MAHFVIVGAGIGGLTAAIALQKAGHKVQVYEAVPQFLPLGAGIVLSANAIKAFESLDIRSQIEAAGHSTDYIHIQSQEGSILAKIEVERLRQRYGRGTFNFHRAELHATLLQQLAPDTVVLGKKITHFEEKNDKVILHFEDDTTAEGDFLIGADGFRSRIRQQLHGKTSFRYAGYTCWRGVCRFDDADFDPLLNTESWGWGERFGVVPLRDGRVYWFMVKNAPPRDLEMSAYDKEKMLRVFGDWHYPVAPLIEATEERNILWHDIIDFKPLKKNWGTGRVTLLGDAAHAMTPNMGQGACQAIEDAVFLGKSVQKYEATEIALRQYESARQKRTAKVVNRSWQMGKIAHWENPVLTSIRNLMMRLTPTSMAYQQLDWLCGIDFEL